MQVTLPGPAGASAAGRPRAGTRVGTGPPSRLLGRSAGDLARLQAGGAHVEPLRGRPDHRADPLDVRVPATLGAPVGVRDRVTEARPLAADVAVGSHGYLLIALG